MGNSVLCFPLFNAFFLLLTLHPATSIGIVFLNPQWRQAHMCAVDPCIPEEAFYEEDGIRYRRRSKSAGDLKGVAREFLAHRGQAAESSRAQHSSKRSSFEAGLPDTYDQEEGPRRSAEKIQRQASRDDFLPTELIQRSHLFNGPS